MKKAVVFYQSKSGRTKSYAQEISIYLQTLQVNTEYYHVNDYHADLIKNTDFLFFGCWTKGLMVFFQKPDEIWNNFAKKISIPHYSKVALFATYKIRTGSMFKNMEKQLKHKGELFFHNLKSRNGKLSEKDKYILNRFIED